MNSNVRVRIITKRKKTKVASFLDNFLARYLVTMSWKAHGDVKRCHATVPGFCDTTYK